ncbi:MAG: alpha-amylase family glycosyl hydrolase [Sumerlaeia bacterium]
MPFPPHHHSLRLLFFFIIFIGFVKAAPAQFTAPPPEDLIFYQIFLDRFANGDPSNDNANPRHQSNPSSPFSFHGGDLEGIRQKIPYIRGMGFNAIWITPHVENVSDYHGYGAWDFTNVDPNFGTLAKMQQLVDEANAAGIAVYYDMVAGHMGNLITSSDDGYPNFLPPPNEYPLRWRNPFRTFPPPFDSLDHFHAHGHIQNFNFPEQELGELSGLDDLKTDTQYVRDEMLKIWEFWVRNTGVSGFRVDTVKHVDIGFWEDFLPRLRAVAQDEGRDNFYMFGEVFAGDDNVMRNYVGTLTTDVYKFDSTIDFPYYFAARDVFGRADVGTDRFANRLENRPNIYPGHHLVTPNFFDNHDVPRFLAEALNVPGTGLAEQHRRLDQALVALFVSPGPPIVYYGTEQAFNGGNDPNNREDMFDGLFEQGPSLGDNFDESAPHYRLIKRLGQLRAERPSLRRGDTLIYQRSFTQPGVLAIARRFQGEEVLAVLNTATSEKFTDPYTTSWAEGQEIVNLLNSNERATVGAGGALPQRTLGPQAAEVWLRAEDLPPVVPEVVGITPADGSVNVGLQSQIAIEFSVPMNREPSLLAVTLEPVSAFTPVWNQESTELTLTPIEPLLPRTTYALTVSTDAVSTGGSPILFPVAARFTTGRDVANFPALPPSYPTMGPTANPPTADGDGGDWFGGAAPPSLVPDSGLVTAEGVFVWRDATGDDDGPGTYVYPTNEAFSGMEADIEEVRVAFDHDFLYLYLRPVGVNPDANFFTAYFGFALDYQAEGLKSSLGVNQSNLATGIAELLVHPDAAPDAEVTVTGPIGIVAATPDGQEIDAVEGFGLNEDTGEVEIVLSRSALGWPGRLRAFPLNLIVYTGLEVFGGMREIEEFEGNFTPGGGSSSTFDPDVFDLAGGTRQAQLADLGDYSDDLPAIVLRSIIPLVLDDGDETVSSIWMFY